jgi:hypothetical protein
VIDFLRKGDVLMVTRIDRKRLRILARPQPRRHARMVTQRTVSHAIAHPRRYGLSEDVG